MNRYVGNLAPMPGVFPDYPAPVVRNAGAEREMVMMRWGMPPPSSVRRSLRQPQSDHQRHDPVRALSPRFLKRARREKSEHERDIVSALCARAKQ